MTSAGAPVRHRSRRRGGARGRSSRTSTSSSTCRATSRSSSRAGGASARLGMVTDARFPLGTAAVLRAARRTRATRTSSKSSLPTTGRAMYFSRAPIPFLRERRGRGDAAARASGSTSACTRTRRTRCVRWVALPVNPLEQIERLEQLRPLAAGMRDGRRVDRRAGPAGNRHGSRISSARIATGPPSPQDDVDATRDTTADDANTSSSPAASSRRSARASPPPRSAGCSSSAGCASR